MWLDRETHAALLRERAAGEGYSETILRLYAAEVSDATRSTKPGDVAARPSSGLGRAVWASHAGVEGDRRPVPALARGPGMGGFARASVDLRGFMCVTQNIAGSAALTPIEDKTVPLINLPSAFSRERREACMARIVEAPIR